MDEESTTPSTGEWVPINVTEITRNGDELPVGVMESFEYFEDMIETGWRLDVYTNQRFLPVCVSFLLSRSYYSLFVYKIIVSQCLFRCSSRC